MIVSESLQDILKPKSPEDIKAAFKKIIFWKNVIDGKLSPANLKYFLDKDFIKKSQEASDYDWGKHSSSWKKKLIYFLSLLKKEKRNTNQFVDGLFKIIDNNTIKDVAALYVSITSYINQEYKKINEKYKKVFGKDLNEEKIGDYHYKNSSGNIFFTEVYKNPSSIKKMDSNIRAVSDKEGNLFLFDKAHLLHGRLLNYLHDRGIMMDAMWNKDENFYDNMITWHRMKDTNKFYLGESYSENEDCISLPRVQKWIKKVKEKNPQFEFVEEFIYDHDRTIY